jgi:uncharacterized protein YbcI
MLAPMAPVDPESPPVMLRQTTSLSSSGIADRRDLASVDVSSSVTITNEVRAACKRLWGRGPEYAQVLFAGEGTVVILFSGILTEAERTLLAVDHERVVSSARAALHEALEPEIRAILEMNTGRETRAFISGVDLNCDIASFVVTLT